MSNNQTELFTIGIERSAELSPCKRYRYTLTRLWDQNKPMAMIIGLNPSTADAEVDDATIRRCYTFIRRAGFGGFHMLNLFAFRATDPAVMKANAEPIGDHNNLYLRHYSLHVSRVIFAWGTNGTHLERDKEVIAMFPEAYCFGLTTDGHPRHPLYLPSSTDLQLFNPNQLCTTNLNLSGNTD